jgi:hypothetical protein
MDKMYPNVLEINEYTRERDALEQGDLAILIIHAALKQFDTNGENWDNYPSYSVLEMINDFCRINQHCKKYLDECLAFIKKKYIDSPVNAVFLELICQYVSYSTFVTMLRNQPSAERIINSKRQLEITKEILRIENNIRSYKQMQNEPMQQVSSFGELDNTTCEPIQNEPKQIKSGIENPKRYKFDILKVTDIYNFCINTNVISNSILNVDFINAVDSADFTPILFDGEKSKCKYIIYILSKIISPEWYLAAAHSINTEPNRCSGINVPCEWKKQANALK